MPRTRMKVSRPRSDFLVLPHSGQNIVRARLEAENVAHAGRRADRLCPCCILP